jgi:hypothetical protein
LSKTGAIRPQLFEIHGRRLHAPENKINRTHDTTRCPKIIVIKIFDTANKPAV